MSRPAEPQASRQAFPFWHFMHANTKILLAISLTLLILGGLVLTYPSSAFMQLFIALTLAHILSPALLLEKRGTGRIAGSLIVFSAAQADYYRSSPCYRGAL